MNLKGLNSVGKSSLNDLVALGVGRVAPGIQARWVWWGAEMAGLSGVVWVDGPPSFVEDVLSNSVSSVAVLFWDLVDMFPLAGFGTFAGFVTFVAKGSCFFSELSPKVNLPTINGGRFFVFSLSLTFWTSRFSFHLRSSSFLAVVSLVATICIYLMFYSITGTCTHF